MKHELKSTLHLSTRWVRPTTEKSDHNLLYNPRKIAISCLLQFWDLEKFTTILGLRKNLTLRKKMTNIRQILSYVRHYFSKCWIFSKSQIHKESDMLLKRKIFKLQKISLNYYLESILSFNIQIFSLFDNFWVSIYGFGT